MSKPLFDRPVVFDFSGVKVKGSSSERELARTAACSRIVASACHKKKLHRKCMGCAHVQTRLYQLLIPYYSFIPQELIHVHHFPILGPSFFVWRCIAGGRSGQLQRQTPSLKRPFFNGAAVGRFGRLYGDDIVAELDV